jgi:hypothetical protein
MIKHGRIKIFLVIASLLAGLIAFPAYAASDTGDIVYITAINNRLLPLNAETMPVKIKSQIYVPCSVFNSSELGTYSYYSRDSQIATVTDGDIKLTFDMSSGTTYDKNGRYYSFQAVYINNTAYLPVYYLTHVVFKNITYTYSRYDGFHLIRLTRGEAYGEEEFIESAKIYIQILLSQYYDSIASVQPTAAVTPTAPVSTASPTPTPGGAGGSADRHGVTVYIAFLGIGSKTEAVLDRLDRYGFKACFFANAAQLREYPGLARRIYGTGHTLGILLGNSPAEEYKESSDVLRSAIGTTVFITAAGEKLVKEQLDEVKKDGLIIWCAEPASENLSSAYTRLEKAKRRFDLILDGLEPPSGNSLEKLLDMLDTYNYTVGRVNELTETRMSYVKAD